MISFFNIYTWFAFKQKSISSMSSKGVSHFLSSVCDNKDSLWDAYVPKEENVCWPSNRVSFAAIPLTTSGALKHVKKCFRFSPDFQGPWDSWTQNSRKNHAILTCFNPFWSNKCQCKPRETIIDWTHPSPPGPIFKGSGIPTKPSWMPLIPKTDS